MMLGAKPAELVPSSKFTSKIMERSSHCDLIVIYTNTNRAGCIQPDRYLENVFVQYLKRNRAAVLEHLPGILLHPKITVPVSFSV
jgi:hypothetical protein